MFVIVNGLRAAGRAGFLAGPMMMQDTAIPNNPQIGRPFTFNSKIKTMSGG